MKHSRSRQRAILLAAVLAAASSQFTLAAGRHVDRTGSRVGSNATSRSVIQLGSSNEVRRVLSLLDEGLTDEALALAEDYLDSLGSASIAYGRAVPQRYDALNALCAALTGAGRLDEALERCSEAIELLPSRWSAINNRGTAYFAQHNYVAALEDYRRARKFARSSHAAATVEHNIRLTEERLAATQASL